MIYLLESELPGNKSVFYSLQNIFGLNVNNSNTICKKLGFSKNLKTNKLSKKQINKLTKTVKSSNLKLSNDLKKHRLFSLKKSVAIKSYKGLRKIKGLPVRGQRTHTNAKSSKKRLK